ncbi:hypothetical protein [Streptomyces sp. NPDC058092]|uniref:hypothetical protein n=1 Tax=Streptomyces sp. NPDC058092 TaxID=3346336 RepID=UPI0036EB31E9
MAAAFPPPPAAHAAAGRVADVPKLPGHRRAGPLSRGERLRGPLIDLILGTDIDHLGVTVSAV